MRSNSSDSSYVSPFLDSLESPFAETVGPLELQSASSPLTPDRQPFCTADEQWPTFSPTNGSLESIPLSSPSSAGTNSPITPTTPSPRRTTRAATTKPPPKKGGRPRKKRNASYSSSEEDSAILKAKHAHSIIERRYRDNLNGKMMLLHRVLLDAEKNDLFRLKDASPGDQGHVATSRVRKSDIMTRAINYIHQSEAQLRHMSDQINRLQEQVRIYQKLVKCEDCKVLADVVPFQR